MGSSSFLAVWGILDWFGESERDPSVTHDWFELTPELSSLTRALSQDSIYTLVFDYSDDWVVRTWTLPDV